MKNLTNFSDNCILSIINACDATPHKCTANVQLDSTTMVAYLNIYEDRSTGWDNNDVLIYTEPLQVSYKEHYGFSNEDNELPF